MLERDEWAMTDKEIRQVISQRDSAVFAPVLTHTCLSLQEERFRRMRRIYCRRGSVRRASTTQLTSGEHVSVDSPPSIADDDSMQKPSRSVTPRMRRKGSAPASLNLYLMDQDEEDQINRTSPFERLSRAWASDGTGSPRNRTPPSRKSSGDWGSEPFSPVLEEVRQRTSWHQYTRRSR